MHLHLHGFESHDGASAEPRPEEFIVSVPPASTRQVPSSSLPEPGAGEPGVSEPGVTVTCAQDGHSHVVPPAVLADSLTEGSGQCTAVCGHVVLPASLASPPGDRCLLCAETSGLTRRSARRRTWSGRVRAVRFAS